jgi:hypothetical protein
MQQYPSLLGFLGFFNLHLSIIPILTMAVTESSIKANHGASVPDTSASQEQMSQANWLQSRGIKVE